MCDRYAERFARCLRTQIERLGKDWEPVVRTKMLINKRTPRRQCDMNRARCRHTPYREELLQFVQENKDSIGFVLDVHSFPPRKNVWGLPSGRQGPDPELVVLDDDFSTTGAAATYSTNFVSTMRNSDGIDAILLPGKGNDIHSRMRWTVGVRSFLLEVREGLPGRRLEAVICPAVARWLVAISLVVGRQHPRK